jgi:hypothetical protein
LDTEASTRARNEAQSRNEVARLSLDWKKYYLDVDALQTNTALKLQELSQTGQKVEGASLTALTEAVGSGQANAALSDRTASMADDFAALPKGTGAGSLSGFNEFLKGRFGVQDGLSLLRAQYEQLIKAGAMKNLPPGSASDADVRLALQGFPSANTDNKYIESFLRGMSKLQAAQATADNARADWISENGNLGKSKRDIVVNGTVVPAGTSFGEFSTNRAKFDKRGAPPARSYLEKYGQ